MGVAAISDLLNKYVFKKKEVYGAVLSGLCLLVPVQMASQTWDDHDRSGRYTCRDFGQNYLMSLQEEGNPIVFTNGDNDTFPLWYTQDVEGKRTDARVCNLSYLQTDWYIDQMRRPAYDSPALPITWSRLEYCAGTNEYVYVKPNFKRSIQELYNAYPEEAKSLFGENPFELENILKYWVRNNINEQQRSVIQMLVGPGQSTKVIPTDTVYVTIDKEAVKRSGMMMASDSIPDRMEISLRGKSALYKGDLMMLEIVAQTKWERPVYVATTVGEDNYMNLGDNFVQEGLVNRITPFTTRIDGREVAKTFDTNRTYDMLMNKFKLGGLDVPGIYLDETVMRMCYTHRRIYVQLALNLLREGEKEKAAKVLEHADKYLPAYNVPYNYASGSLDAARAYIMLDNKERAMEIMEKLWNNSVQYMRWYCSLTGTRFSSSQRECLMHLYILQNIVRESAMANSEWSEQKSVELENIADAYASKGGRFQ